MSNSLFPGFVKIFYQSPQSEHVMTIPANVQTDAGGWKLQGKDNAFQTLAVGAAALVVALKALLKTDCSFNYAELWRMVTPTSDPIYVETANLNTAGTNAGTTNLASQITYSYRSVGGGFGKLVLMDHCIAVNQKYLPPNYGNATIKAVMDFILSPTTWIFCRDNTYPTTGIKAVTKTNDALRKKYNYV